MSSSQVGKTSVVENCIGYFVDQDPSPMLVVEPTLEMAEAFSKERLAPLIRDNARIRDRISDAKSRSSGNTLRHKVFSGGFLALAGANSPASLAARPVRIVICDELDRFEASAGAEGDPAAIAKKRSTRFWNRKSLLFSTPTLKSTSRIAKAFALSDQRYFYVPCPNCRKQQRLEWQQVRWRNRDPSTAVYVCIGCSKEWDDAARWHAVSRGRWEAHEEFSGTAGFHLNELYAPGVTLRSTVKAFLDAKGDRELLKVWTNTSLGEPWDDSEGEGVEWMSLRDRAEEYSVLGDDDFVLPEGVLYLSVGVDTHPDRLPVQVIGFGRGEECWPIYYGEIEGDPVNDEVWEELDRDILNRPYRHPWGVDLYLQTGAVDTGGPRTQATYAACRKRAPRIMAIKGLNQPGRPVLAGRPTPQDISFRGAKVQNGVLLWSIGTDTAKSDLYGRFGITEPGPRYVHFPKAFSDFYFDGVVSEKSVTRFSKGIPRVEWILPPGKRNEPLDTFVYAYAAALRGGLQRINWDALEKAIQDVGARGRTDGTDDVGPEPIRPTPATPRRRRRRLPRSTWMQRGRR